MSHRGSYAKRAILTLGLIALLSTATAAIAPAKKGKRRTVATQISIAVTGTSGQFLDLAGKVSSGNAKCRSRTVNVDFFSEQTGIASHRGNPTSDSAGNWTLAHVGHHGGSGSYVASVRKVTRGNVTCKPAQASVPFP